MNSGQPSGSRRAAGTPPSDERDRAEARQRVESPEGEEPPAAPAAAGARAVTRASCRATRSKGYESSAGAFLRDRSRRPNAPLELASTRRETRTFAPDRRRRHEWTSDPIVSRPDQTRGEGVPTAAPPRASSRRRKRVAPRQQSRANFLVAPSAGARSNPFCAMARKSAARRVSPRGKPSVNREKTDFHVLDGDDGQAGRRAWAVELQRRKKAKKDHNRRASASRVSVLHPRPARI